MSLPITRFAQQPDTARTAVPQASLLPKSLRSDRIGCVCACNTGAQREPSGGFLRSAFTYQHQPDMLQQLHRPIHSLGQKEVGAGLTFVNFYLAGKKNR